jgi:hypothetical protein
MAVPMLIFALTIALLSASITAEDGSERSEAYDAMLGCAAFHTIESTTSKGDAAEAQLAIAYDFAASAAELAPDGQTATANADLEKRLAEYRSELDTGDVREMAEEWTAMESACREIYPLRAAIGKALGKSEPADPGR